eukprot:2382011-Prymnesium_polylepis.1
MRTVRVTCYLMRCGRSWCCALGSSRVHTGTGVATRPGQRTPRHGHMGRARANASIATDRCGTRSTRPDAARN